MNHQISAGGIIIKKENGQSKIILVELNGGDYTFPKGRIEKGETEEQAAIREAEEETVEKYGWFTLEEALEKLYFPQEKQFLKNNWDEINQSNL